MNYTMLVTIKDFEAGYSGNIQHEWSQLLWPIDERCFRLVRSYGYEFDIVGWRRSARLTTQLALSNFRMPVVYGPCEPEEVLGG